VFAQRKIHKNRASRTPTRTTTSLTVHLTQSPTSLGQSAFSAFSAFNAFRDMSFIIELSAFNAFHLREKYI
jgi:hypothetical protein